LNKNNIRNVSQEILTKFFIGLGNMDFDSFMVIIFGNEFQHFPYFQVKQWKRMWSKGPGNIWYFLDIAGQERLLDHLYSDSFNQ